MRLIIYILLLFCISGNSFSQNSFSQISQIRFEKISIEKGLSQSSVHTILQDSEGFLWFGTQDGLNRYDGYEFKVFKPIPSDSNSISDTWINSLLEDKYGNIWIGTYGGGLNKYNRKTNQFSHFSIKEKLSDRLSANLIKTIYYDSNDLLWIGTTEGLFKFNLLDNSIEEIDIFEFKGTIDKIIADTKNNLWIATNKSGIIKYDPLSNSLLKFNNSEKNNLFSNSVNSILFDKKGNLWAASPNGIGYLPKNEKRFIRIKAFDNDELLKSVNFQEIFQLENDILWFGTDGAGIVQLNTVTNQYKKFGHNPFDLNSLSDDRPISFLKDRAGVIWIGTYGGGISKFDKKKIKFKLYRKNLFDDKSLNDDFIHTITSDINGTVWIGTATGLNKLNPETLEIERIQIKHNGVDAIGQRRIMSLVTDDDNNLWIGTWGGGLIKYDIEDKKINIFNNDKHNSNSLINNRIRNIFIDNAGNLWIGTLNGFSIFNPQKNQFKNINKLFNSNSEVGIVRYFAQDKKGFIWIATETDGLIIYNPESNTFSNYLNDPNDSHSLSSNRISSILEDSKGRMWIGTFGGGINLFDTKSKTFKRFTTANGFYDNVVYGILEDEEENLWISTNSGIIKFNSTDYTTKTFTILDGLQSNEFNGGAYYKTESGEMYFGGIKGLNSFKPETLELNTTEPPIVLTDFKVFDKNVDFGQSINSLDNIKLSYSQNFISFEFAALDFTTSELNQYAYKLEGFDKDWINCGNRRYVSYTNLEPGEYIFRVIGSNNDGVWNNKGASIKLEIVPPFYKTWFFKLILIGTILVGWIVIYEIRVNSVQKQKERLTELVDSRTEELKNKKEELQKINNEQSVLLNKISESESALKEINSNKDKLFSIIAHDLKSPFTSLLGFSDLLIKEINNLSKDEIKEYLTNINGSLNNLLNLLNNLLQWSRVQTNSIEFTFSMISLFEISERVVALVKGNAVKKNITIINNIDKSIEVYADNFSLSLILQNLISNSVKFTKPGGEIILTSKIEHNFVEVCVKDNGVGISQNDLEKLFTKQGAHSTMGTAKETGTGLGLMLCKDFIEKNGGSIDVESKVNEGTVFKIKLLKSAGN